LIGHQTRLHEDLDLVVALQDVDAIKAALDAFGYVVAEDHLPVRFVMRDKSGSQLDFHTVIFDERGGGVQQLPDGDSFLYPAEGFIRGHIAGQPVPCISAEVQVLWMFCFSASASTSSFHPPTETSSDRVRPNKPLQLTGQRTSVPA
jgi:lincosamide nucleotidyltransferase A/C/D/E